MRERYDMNKFILSGFADEIDQDLKTQMDVLEQHGVNYIEMRGVNGKKLIQYNLEEVKEIKTQLDKRGFKISAIGSSIGKIKITEDFEPHLQLFRHTLEIAKILETKYIRMFSFYIPEEENPAVYRDEVIRRWKEFIKAAKDYDVVLLHENEKNIYGDTAERCLDLLKGLNCNFVKATFDPANFIQCNVETYPYAYNLLKDYIEYVHIKDANFKDHCVVPSGEGDGKLQEILVDLNNNGFEGFLSIEPHLGSFTGFDELEIGVDISSMPIGGTKRFLVALYAIRNIINEI